MMNRSAELLFWIGRYLERTENHTRLIDVNYHMRHELKGSADQQECVWERLVTTIGSEYSWNKSDDQLNETTALALLTFDRTNVNSIYTCIYQARSNMRALRQLLPDELWDIMNASYLWLKEQDIHNIVDQSPHLFYQRIREWLAGINGTADSAILRGQEWNFIQAGKYLERTENMLRLLQTVYSNLVQDRFSTIDQKQYNRMIILLKSVGGYEAFRKFHADDVTFEKIFEFIMLNSQFPRSVSFSLSSLETSLLAIKQHEYQLASLSDQAIDLTARVKEVLNGMKAEGDGLDLLQEMMNSCHQLDRTISENFFQEEFVEA
ncbi:alpha-E domain-containing protein [Halalkalibacter lacteus]|uniref:alpha-E domain-containing protein n=1 Tax=Halalkalibacter lacteus TaxID=3090663 RepID=UPI002FCB84E5